MKEEASTFESALIYALLFSAFGLFTLAIMSPRYEKLQTDIENQYHGVQEMQRQAGGLAPHDEQPPQVERDHSIDISAQVGDSSSHLLVQLRPLNIILGVVMLGAWAVLMYRRAAASRNANQQTNDDNGAGEGS